MTTTVVTTKFDSQKLEDLSMKYIKKNNAQLFHMALNYLWENLPLGDRLFIKDPYKFTPQEKLTILNSIIQITEETDVWEVRYRDFPPIRFKGLSKAVDFVKLLIQQFN